MAMFVIKSVPIHMVSLWMYELQSELSHFEQRISKAEYMEGRVKKLEHKISRGEDIALSKLEKLKQGAEFQNRKVRVTEGLVLQCCCK